MQSGLRPGPRPGLHHVVVTGAAGLLGAELSRRLRGSGRFAVTTVARGPLPGSGDPARAARAGSPGGIPDANTPDANTPGGGISGAAAPGRTATGQTMTGQGATGEAAPGEAAAGEAATGGAATGRHVGTDRLFDAGWIAGLPPDTTVIHCAGLSNPRHPFGGFAEVLRDHVLPHLDMVAALLARGWRGRLIYPSSGGTIYGEPKILPIPETHPLDPVSLYGLQKLCVERGLGDLAERHGFSLAVLRISNPYGAARLKAGQGVIPILIHALRHDAPFRIIGDGTAQRDYIHMDDLWEALVRVIDDPLPEGRLMLNIGSGQGVSLNALIAELEALTGHRLRGHHVPVEQDVASNVLDCSLARHRLGWCPRVGLREGLRRTLEILQDDPPA